MLDFNSSTQARQSEAASITEQVNSLIDAGLVARNGERQRNYLGASALGAACLRQIQYDYLNVPRDFGFSGGTLRIFAAGHAFEDMTAEEIRAGGFDLRTAKQDGSQFGFSTAGGKFKGHIDGVLVGGPDFLQYPALWEHKAVGQRSWNEIIKKGVTIARPIYAAQVALYQAYMDLPNPALFTIRHRDTQALHHQLVPFDPALAQRISDKAVQIIRATDAGEQLPRVAQSPDHRECKLCAWRTRCWK